mmetsp:Transcript_31080/g.90264  ORF Transcript_31080/g.90264 Transcript_31080/m.90264 type:complete len:106 (+) Transcript_31080:149-466(+)
MWTHCPARESLLFASACRHSISIATHTHGRRHPSIHPSTVVTTPIRQTHPHVFILTSPTAHTNGNGTDTQRLNQGRIQQHHISGEDSLARQTGRQADRQTDKAAP